MNVVVHGIGFLSNIVCRWIRPKYFGSVRMLLRNLGADQQRQQTAWADLAEGAPTIIGFADLCGLALANPRPEFSVDQLSDEAKTILIVAANRGTMDIRAKRDSFDSAARLLAVCVEFELDRRLLFLSEQDPKQSLRFLDGFRQLCEHGLIIHHLQKDFSLSSQGFEVANRLVRSDYENLIEFAVELEH